MKFSLSGAPAVIWLRQSREFGGQDSIPAEKVMKALYEKGKKGVESVLDSMISSIWVINSFTRNWEHL